MLKRTIAMLIAALMIVACVPVLSFANSPSPAPQDKYTVEIKSGNPNAGTVKKSRIDQDRWRIIATPNEGYTFVKWEVAGGAELSDIEFDPNTTTATVVVTVKKDAEIRAIFAKEGTGGEQGGQTPGGEQGGQTPGGEQGGQTPGGEQGGQTPGGEQGGQTPGGDQGSQSPETGYSIALLVLACVSSLAGAAFVAKKVRA